MTTADYALLVSLTSLLVAMGALIWNVWQKFIFVKPEVHVSFGIWSVLRATTPDSMGPSGQRLLILTAANMGPGPVVLTMCIVKRNGQPRNSPFGLINPIDGDPRASDPVGVGPFGAGPPLKIDAGDTKSFYFPYGKDSFLTEGIARVGINDTYHRNTWCSRQDMEKVNQAYRKEFGSSEALK